MNIHIRQSDLGEGVQVALGELQGGAQDGLQCVRVSIAEEESGSVALFSLKEVFPFVGLILDCLAHNTNDKEMAARAHEAYNSLKLTDDERCPLN